jgi:hypothetical protein
MEDEKLDGAADSVLEVRAASPEELCVRLLAAEIELSVGKLELPIEDGRQDAAAEYVLVDIAKDSEELCVRLLAAAM